MKKKRNGFEVMCALIGLVKPLAGFMCLAIVMGVIGHLAATGITVLGAYALAKVSGEQIVLSLGTIFVLLLFLALLRGFLRYAEQACNHFIAFKLLALIREKVFFALRKLAPAKLEGRKKGDLISIITSDIELLEVFYAHTISPIVIAVCYCLILILFLGSFHPVYALAAGVAYLSIGLILPLTTSRLSGEDGLHFRMKSGELSAYVLDSLRGLPEILQYGCGEERRIRMGERTESLFEEEERQKFRAGANQALTNGLILLFDLAILCAAAFLWKEGRLDFLGVLIPSVTLMSSFGPTVALAALGSTLQNTFAAGNRVLDILEETPMTEEICGRKEVAFHGGRVREVSFAYETEEILSQVSMEFSKGEIIGIRGKSGSGKSTLLKLIMRFWKTTEGRIEISDTSLEEINTSDLREMEAYVTQETHLFHDSIRNNLKIAKLDATEEELKEACRKASIHEFIERLPMGYDTPVGELGDSLSGGERQRLGLARAFLHEAPLLLLDEPTSNLDSLNEGMILRALREETKGRTVLLVSHRDSTMRIADRTYSVEHGRVS